MLLTKRLQVKPNLKKHRIQQVKHKHGNEIRNSRPHDTDTWDQYPVTQPANDHGQTDDHIRPPIVFGEVKDITIQAACNIYQKGQTHYDEHIKITCILRLMQKHNDQVAV